MKILAPIKSHDELEMLVESGAEELYCGITPEEWQQEYSGAAWLSRRSPKGGGFESWSELRKTVDDAHRAGLHVFITLNAPFYTTAQMDSVVKIAHRLDDEIGADALIIADPNLLLRMRQEKIRAALHVSSVAAALNSEAIRFLLDFGVKRVVLPRSVGLSEIEAIVNAVRGEVEIETFILNDGCAFEEGFCSTTHHHAVGAFCTGLSGMDTEFEGVAGQDLTYSQTVKLKRNLLDYWKYIWYLNGNGCSTAPNGLPYGPCGLCAIKDLMRIGVDSLKIVGRESGPFKKLASVKMVADIVRKARAGADRLYLIERARSLRNTQEHCDAGFMCYYRGESPVPEEEALLEQTA